MKYLVILCSSIIVTSVLAHQTETENAFASQNMIESVARSQDISDSEFKNLRSQVTQQTIQIKGILDTLCDAVKNSQIPTKDLVCRELSLLRDFIQNMVTELPEMSYKNLINLITINNQLLEQLHEQLISGDLCGLCNLDSSLFTTLSTSNRDVTDQETFDFYAIIASMQEKISALWNLVSSISLTHYAPAPTSAASAVWNFIDDNKGYAGIAAALAGAALMFRKDNPIDLIAGLAQRAPVYSLVALYLLRQQQEDDATELAHAWFGQDSYSANAMITLKKWLGNSTEVESEEILLKLPLAVLLSYQVKNDALKFSERIGGFVKKTLTCLLEKK